MPSARCGSPIASSAARSPDLSAGQNGSAWRMMPRPLASKYVFARQVVLSRISCGTTKLPTVRPGSMPPQAHVARMWSAPRSFSAQRFAR
ncbi:MAG: hypothetical protein NT049_07995 [Planctomycetota bacterium]|nr:hypothetical protein [Planctomycetota bacterium]